MSNCSSTASVSHRLMADFLIEREPAASQPVSAIAAANDALSVVADMLNTAVNDVVPNVTHEFGKNPEGLVIQPAQNPAQGAPKPEAEPRSEAKKRRRSQVKVLLDAEAERRIEGKPKSISPESQQTLRYISEDFVLDAVSGNPLRISSGLVLSRIGFRDLCQQEYGFVVGLGEGNVEVRANSGDVWLAWSDWHRRSIEQVVMEPNALTAEQDAELRPLVLNRWHTLKEAFAAPCLTATRADIKPVENFLLKLSDGDQLAVCYVLNVLAQIWLTPGIKIPTAFLLITPFGRIGKNLFFRLVRNIFGGPALCGEGAGNKLLTSNFDDGVADKLFRGLNEVRLVGKGSQEAYDNLKTLISESEGSFEGKGTKRVDAKNVAYFIMNSNHDDALPIMEDEGRICVLRSTARRAQTPEGEAAESAYYKTLVDWIDGPGPALMAGAFTNWEFPKDWDPYAPVPQTAASRAMQKAAQGDLYNNMLELVEAGAEPFDRDILMVADVTAVLLRLYAELWGRDCKINTTTVGAVLKRIFDEPVAMKVEGLHGKALKKGEKSPVMRVYVQRHLEQWKAATPKQRGDYLNTGVRLFAVQPDCPKTGVSDHD